LAWQRNACNLLWQGRILWLRPAVEWTVLLLDKTSKEKDGRWDGRQEARMKGLWKQLNGEQGWMD